MKDPDCLFNDITIYAQPAAVWGSTLSDDRRNVTVAKLLPMRLGIIAAIRKQFIRFAFGMARLAADLRNGIDQRQQLRDIMAVGGSGVSGQRRTVRVGNEMVLKRFEEYWGPRPPIDRIVFKTVPDLSSRVLLFSV